MITATYNRVEAESLTMAKAMAKTVYKTFDTISTTKPDLYRCPLGDMRAYLKDFGPDGECGAALYKISSMRQKKSSQLLDTAQAPQYDSTHGTD